jgi:hypothetical protein
MLESIIYPNIENIIKTHSKILEISGGMSGLINIGLLESTLAHMQNDTYYPSLEQKATHLMYSIMIYGETFSEQDLYNIYLAKKAYQKDQELN